MVIASKDSPCAEIWTIFFAYKLHFRMQILFMSPESQAGAFPVGLGAEGGSLGQNWGQARARGHRMRSAHTCFSTFCAPQGPFRAQKGAELAKVGPQLLPGLGPEAQVGRQAGLGRLGRVGKSLAPTFTNPRPAGAPCVPPMRVC